MIFLVADRTRIEELKQATRLFLAWNSIEKERDLLNLDAFQGNQAKDKRNEAEKHIRALIPETYCWLLVPEQPDPRRPDSIGEYKLQAQTGSRAVHASSLLRTEEFLITQLAGSRLRQELNTIPLWRGNHVSTKELVENFARYIYLPRLKHKDVLIDAIRDGVQAASWLIDTFAYASGWNADRQSYATLVAGRAVNVIVDGQSLLVKSEVAEEQMIADAVELEEKLRVSRTSTPPLQATNGSSQYDDRDRESSVHDDGANSFAETPGSQRTRFEEKQLHRFYASVQINERMMASDAGKIMEEVVKHLTSLSGANVKVTLEITAELPDGAPDQVVRTVKENSNTLRFQTSEFHEE